MYKSNLTIWNSHTLSEALSIDVCIEINSTAVVIDSRIIKKDDIFIGLQGLNCNGSMFAFNAILKGASLCIVNYIPDDCLKYKNQIIIVENTYEALYKLAFYKRSKFQGKIIAITGSVGKTSTKEMLKLAISGVTKRYFANFGNFNNSLGLHLSLANLNTYHKYGIFELGMDRSGQIKKLSILLKPDIAVILNVEAVHIEFFSSLIDIAKAKCEIYEGLNQDGISIYSQDTKNAFIFKRPNSLCYGTNINNNIILIKHYVIKKYSKKYLKIVAAYNNKLIKYQLKLIGLHFIQNSLAVLTVLLALKVNIYKSLNKLKYFSPLLGRGKIYYLKKNIKLIDESYNASPISVKTAISNIRFANSVNRIIVILGDMKEQGQAAVEAHMSIKKYLIKEKIDMVFTVGEMMHNLFLSLPSNIKGISTSTSEEMSNKIIDLMHENDTILVKGSNSMHMKLICNRLIDTFGN